MWLSSSAGLGHSPQSPVCFQKVTLPVRGGKLVRVFYLFIFVFVTSREDTLTDFRGEGREREREGEKHRSVASHTHPDQGPNTQSRHAP